MPDPASFSIRRAVTVDLDAIVRVWQAAWFDGHLGHVPPALLDERTPRYFAGKAAELLDSTLVAVDDTELLGVAFVSDDELVQLPVSGAARRRGVGGALIQSAEQRIALQHPVAWLAVVPGNTRARQFYERLGWTDAGGFTYWAPGAAGPIAVPAHRYEKSLARTG